MFTAEKARMLSKKQNHEHTKMFNEIFDQIRYTATLGSTEYKHRTEGFKLPSEEEDTISGLGYKIHWNKESLCYDISWKV